MKKPRKTCSAPDNIRNADPATSSDPNPAAIPGRFPDGGSGFPDQSPGDYAPDIAQMYLLKYSPRPTRSAERHVRNSCTIAYPLPQP